MVGLVLVGVAGPGHAERAFAAWLVAFVFFLSIALGCLYFVLIHTAMQGAWGIVVRRVAENAAATLPLFAVLFVPVILGPARTSTPGAARRWSPPTRCSSGRRPT